MSTGHRRRKPTYRQIEERLALAESALAAVRRRPDGASGHSAHAHPPSSPGLRPGAAPAQTAELLETLLASMPLGFCHLDRELRFLRINERLAAMNGIPAADHIGKTIAEIVPALAPTVREVTARILATGKAVVGHEFGGETPAGPGATRWWSESWYPVRDAGGAITGFGVIVEEITARKRAGDEVRQLAQFPEQNPNPVLRVAADGALLYVNTPGRAWLEALGWSGAPALPAAVREVVASARGHHRAINAEVRAPGGTTHSVSAIRPPGEDYVNLYSRDITERKQAEAALVVAHRQTQSLIDNTPSMVYACDLEARFVMVNAALAALLKTTPQQMLGKRRGEFMPQADADAHEADDREVIAAGQAVDFEEHSELPGRSITWLSTKFPLRDAQGRIYAVAGIVTDITERKQAEERARREQRDTAFANRVLGAFIEYEGDELFAPALAIVQEEMASEQGVFGYIAEPGHLICPSLSPMLEACEVAGKCIHYPPEKWKGLWARALTEKRSFYTNERQRVPAGHVVVHNNLAAPILFQGEAIGLLNLANKDGGYTDADRDRLDALAARVAPVLYAWIQRTLRETERQQAEAELRRSREDLDRAQAVGQIGWWRLDTRKDVLTWSPETHRIFGVPEGTPLTYETFLAAVHPDDREYVDAQWTAALRGEPYDIEHRIVADGRVKWVRQKAYLEFDGAGALLGGFGITQDITARREAEEALRQAKAELEQKVHERTAALGSANAALRESQLRLLQMAESAAEVFWLMDIRTSAILYVSPAFEQVWGRTCQEFYDRPHLWLDAIHPQDRARVEASFIRQCADGRSWREEYRVVRPDGAVRWVSDHGVPVRDADGTAYRMAGVAQDITDRKQAAEQAEWYQRRLRALALELTLVEERERRRLAEGLHDHVCQLLAAIKIRLAQVPADRLGADDRELLAEASRLLGEADEASRSLTLQLSHPALYDLGFRAGVQWLAEDVERLHGLKVTVDDDRAAEPMDERIAVVLFRSLRELLVNVAKHAGVKQARVRIRQRDGRLHATVLDGGAGFDIDAVRGRASHSGFGLFSIGARLDNLGGRARIRSAPDRGTAVILEVPLAVLPPDGPKVKP